MKAVILAGGLGTRLKPFTQVIPKPLLPLGEKSVLEIQIEKLAQYGFKDIYIATNYKAKYVESFIGDGERLGVKITFSKEDKPLGTCGPLSLLKNEFTEPFILLNGDILTTIDFTKFYSFADSRRSELTVATKKLRTPFNFGSVKSENDLITHIEEKPDLLMEIVAGIYFMRPSIFRHIPYNEYFGIDDLINKMLVIKTPISRYVIHEFWLDIGQLDDYSDAQLAYEKNFKMVE
jgi:NDP-sugar pyrophosphorylase family protein